MAAVKRQRASVVARKAPKTLSSPPGSAAGAQDIGKLVQKKNHFAIPECS